MLTELLGADVPTSEQAAKFWPVFQSYQKAQNAIMDDQLRGIQRFIESFDTLAEAGALGLINAHFDRDARMNALRQKWLPEFQKTVGTKTAVRVMQIDRLLRRCEWSEWRTGASSAPVLSPSFATSGL